MILDDIVRDKQKRLEEHKRCIGETQMRQLAGDCKRSGISFYDALSSPGLSIIGEFKKASPSLGNIRNTLELTDRIAQYNASVDAISCLTEEDHFHGNVDYFKSIREITPLPMIRKDFIIEPYQVYEAKVIGADAVLLIAAILEDEQMRALYELAYALGMDVLLEVHDEQEMERALRLDAKIIGVNNRNLKDFTISLEHTRRLSKMVPGGKVLVSESGVTKEEDLECLKGCGVDALLIGRAFMESEHPGKLADRWKAVFSAGGGR